MNTEDIQRIVIDLAQAKGTVQEFAETSVGQFRQVQTVMSDLAQTAGEQLGGLSGPFETAGQEISENAVPLLQDAVDALLGDLGKLGNLGDVIPGGEQLGGAVETLTTALGGLSGFLAESSDLIGKIGLSEEHTQRIAQVATTVLTVRSHLVEVGTAATGTMESIKTFTGTLGKAAEAVPALKNVLGPASTALKGLGAIGVTAFVGWEIGKVIGEVTGLNAKLSQLAENRALKNQKSDLETFRELWVGKYGSLESTNRNGQTAEQAWEYRQQRDRERAEGRNRPPAEKEPEPTPSAPPEGNHPADQAEPELIKAGGKEQTKAEEDAAEQVIAEREEALQEQEGHDQTAIAARETFADQASRTIKRGGQQLAQAETDAACQVRQARAQAAKDQKSDDSRRAAKPVAGKVRSARATLPPAGTRKKAGTRAPQKERAAAPRQATRRGRELPASADPRSGTPQAETAAGQRRRLSPRTKAPAASPRSAVSGPAGQPATTVPPPQPPPLCPPPANAAGILDELKNHTRLLSQIARSEGVR